MSVPLSPSIGQYYSYLLLCGARHCQQNLGMCLHMVPDHSFPHVPHKFAVIQVLEVGDAGICSCIELELSKYKSLVTYLPLTIFI
jgi:hypothetical protein